MEAPDLTVVIPSVNGLTDLRGCLEAIERMRGSLQLEVLVVDRLGGEVPETVRKLFPNVTVVPAPKHETIPQMRERAFGFANGRAVAVIEDHVIVPVTWGRQLLDALADGHDVVGGLIENAATERLLDWATFLCEYSGCLPPRPVGRAEWLPGNNVVYRRSVLEKYRAVIAEGRWESRLHEAIKEGGTILWCQPDLLVGHKKHFGFFEYISQRYLYARSYTGAIGKGAPLVKRLAYGVATPFALNRRTIR